MSMSFGLPDDFVWNNMWPVQGATGQKVKFTHPNAGRKGDQEQCKKYLKLVGEYTIKKMEIHSSSSSVTLEEFPDVTFNICMFDDVEKE